MTPIRVGWYVHHHGMGHVTRLKAIAPHIDGEIVCFSSLAEPRDLPSNCVWIALERDDTDEPESLRDPADSDPTAGGLLHWAPLLHGGQRRRLAAIAGALEATPVSAFVVDVSVEVTLFVRLLGIPPILLTQPGERDDEPHRLAFRAAAKVIAPWPRELLEPTHLRGLRNILYVGGVSRFADHVPSSGGRSGVVMLSGAGGSGVPASVIDKTMEATAELEWTFLGATDGSGGEWVNDPWEALCSAAVVVARAGQNSIADIAAAGAPAIIISQSRPFGEQLQTADALERAGLAIVQHEWPQPEEWSALLTRAQALEPDWSRWRTRGAAERAAHEIASVALAEPQ